RRRHFLGPSGCESRSSTPRRNGILSSPRREGARSPCRRTRGSRLLPSWQERSRRDRAISVAFLSEVESDDPADFRGLAVESNRGQGVVRRGLHEASAVGPAGGAVRARPGGAGGHGGQGGGGHGGQGGGRRRHGAPLYPARQPPR